MARYEIHRTDSNAAALYEYLQARGASVALLGTPVDAAVGFQGVSALVEVKTAKGKLRASQRAFLDGWRGLSAVLRSWEDCDELLYLMGGRAARLQNRNREVL